ILHILLYKIKAIVSTMTTFPSDIIGGSQVSFILASILISLVLCVLSALHCKYSGMICALLLTTCAFCWNMSQMLMNIGGSYYHVSMGNTYIDLLYQYNTLGSMLYSI